MTDNGQPTDAASVRRYSPRAPRMWSSFCSTMSVSGCQMGWAAKFALQPLLEWQKIDSATTYFMRRQSVHQSAQHF